MEIQPDAVVVCSKASVCPKRNKPNPKMQTAKSERHEYIAQTYGDVCCALAYGMLYEHLDKERRFYVDRDRIRHCCWGEPYKLITYKKG